MSLAADADGPLLPHDTYAERLCLGSILQNDERFSEVSTVLRAEDFSLEKHRRIFDRMKDLFDRGQYIDRVGLIDELRKRQQLDSVGGITFIVSLDDGLPEVVHLDSYLNILKDKSILRQTMLACQSIIDRCSLEVGPPDGVLDGAARLLDEIRKNSTASGEWETPGQLLERRGVDGVLFPLRGTGTGILETPWPKLTEMTSGWNRGDLVVVGARPGMGKSVFGMQQAHTTAAKQKIGTAFVSLEMSAESLTRRLVAGIAKVDAHRMRSGHLDTDERRRMLKAVGELQDVPLFIEPTGAHTPAAVTAAIRKLKTRTNLGLIIVDHLQLMRVTGRAESRHHELSEICHGFKRLARQLDCVIILLSQLNRACEQERRRPNLSDLKESGAIEEDADAVLFIHRPELYNREDPSLRGKAEFIVAKQRNGPTGKLPMTFLHCFQKFEEATDRTEDQS